MFICLETQKQGFLAGCRPVIGLDRYFIKNEFGGQIFNIMGKDVNNNFFPFIYTVVEGDTRSSWEFFLIYLLEYIGSEQHE